MPSEDRVKIALIGAGSMAHAHARTFQAMPDCTVTAVCDVDAARAKAFAAQYNILHVYTDVAELLAHAPCDAVSNITPDAFHAPISLAAIAAGKHILCEKPLATTVAEAEAMTTAAQAAGVIHMVNFSYRRSAALHEAHRRIQAGEIGRVMHFEAAYLQSWLVAKAWGDWRTDPTWLWRLSTEHGSAGVLGDIGVHILDFAGYPAGDFKSVQCRLKTFAKAPNDQIGPYPLDANDSALILAELTNGALGTIQMTRWATGHLNSLRLSIHGDCGALRLNLDHSYEILEMCHGEDVDHANWQEIHCDPAPSMLHRFIASIRTGQNDQPDFARGTAIQRVLAACVTSDAQHGARIMLP